MWGGFIVEVAYYHGTTVHICAVDSTYILLFE